MTILNEVSLGQHYYTMAVLLRSTLVMISMLLNSESLLQKNISELEAVDKVLLRRILETPVSTGIPALYLELGCIPIKYVIIGRRIMFLHYILNCDTKSKVFFAQRNSPIKNDWSSTVKEDL